MASTALSQHLSSTLTEDARLTEDSRCQQTKIQSMSYIKYSFFILFGFFSVSMIAQTEVETGLPNSEIEIIKSFNARLDEAQILNIPLTVHRADTNRAFIRQYKLSPQPIKLSYPAPQMKPLAMPQDENPVNLPFYAKVGYGLKSNPFAEIAHYYAKGRFNLTSFGSFESIQDNQDGDRKFQDIDVHLDANIGLNDMLLLQAKAAYLRQDRNYYASKVDFFERIKSFTHSIPQVHLGLQNAIETSSNIDYNLGYTFRNFSDDFGNQEANHLFSADAIKSFDKNKFRIGLHANAELNKLSSTTDISLNNYVLGADLGLNKDKWNIKAGVDAAILDDEVKLLPQAILNMYVSPAVNPYLGVRSAVRQNNYYQLTRLNPYLSPFFDGMTNETDMEVFLGVQGKFDRAQYELSAGYEIAENKVLYINNFPDTSTFSALSDDVNTLNIAVKGEVEPIQYLITGAGISTYIYSTDQAEEAWHLPTLSWNLYVRYNQLLNKKLSLTAQFKSRSGIKYFNPFGDTETLKAQLLFDILADYQINPNVDAFIHFNNLFDNEAARYFGYDLIGINPQVGIKIRL
jgi:hypothetical protein